MSSVAIGMNLGVVVDGSALKFELSAAESYLNKTTVKSYLSGALGAACNDVLAGGASVGVLGLSCNMLGYFFWMFNFGELIQRTLRSSSALVFAQAALSFPRRPFRAPLARRLPRIPSAEMFSLESQQEMSPELHCSLAPPRAWDSERDMAVAEAARASTAEIVNFMMLFGKVDWMGNFRNDGMDDFHEVIEASTLYDGVWPLFRKPTYARGHGPRRIRIYCRMRHFNFAGDIRERETIGMEYRQPTVRSQECQSKNPECSAPPLSTSADHP